MVTVSNVSKKMPPPCSVYLVFLLNFLFLSSWFGLINAHGKEAAANNTSREWEITGGVNAEFYYVVSVKVTTKKLVQGVPHEKQCTGTYFATPFYVLSAAHCFLEDLSRKNDIVAADKVLLRFGSIHRDRGGKTATVRFLHIPEEYKKNQPDQETHDIAVLVTHMRIQTGPTIKTLSLPPKAYTPTLDGKITNKVFCTVAGFGMSELLSYSDRMMYVDMQLISNEECAGKMAKQSSKRSPSDTQQMCGFNKGKGPCPGDGGSPLVCKGDKYVVGVFSYNENCYGPEFPAVFTRVDKNLQFINSKKNWQKNLKNGASAPILLAPHAVFIFALWVIYDFHSSRTKLT